MSDLRNKIGLMAEEWRDDCITKYERREPGEHPDTFADRIIELVRQSNLVSDGTFNEHEALIKAAKEAFDALPLEKQEEMLRQQAESYGRSCVRGDMTDEEWAKWS